MQTDDCEHGFVVLKKLRMPQNELTHPCEVASDGSRKEVFVVGELRPSCAMTDQQLRDVLARRQHSVLDDGLARIEVDPARICAVLQQPACSLNVIGYGVSEKVRQRTRNPFAPQLVR